jgi:hypothetical protein
MINQNQTKSPESRQLVIHAGTHKTASSYIQSCIRNNIGSLKKLGISVSYAQKSDNTHKSLAQALKESAWDEWHKYLKKLPKDQPIHLMTAEQFTQPLAKPRVLEPLKKLCQEFSLDLKVIAFVRDQPDYHNSKYVHAIRRLYHAMTFEESIKYALENQMHIYDYSIIFSRLIKDSAIGLTVLPYGSRFGDPFRRLIEAIGIEAQNDWKAANPDHQNVQPGRKGVWLSMEVYKQLAEREIPRDSLKNISGSVRSIALREGWTDDRYYGFDNESESELRKVFEESNNKFAQQVWGESWESKFPNRQVEQQVYALPESGDERDQMLAYVSEAMDLLQGKKKRA